MMKKGYLLPLVAFVGLLCINMGDKSYSKSVSKDQPESFSLKEGRSSFTAVISDGKSFRSRLVRQICFRDSTYADCSRNEGDVYLKVKEEDADIEEKIYLKDIASLELVTKAGCRLCASEKSSGVLFFWLKVTFSSGNVREYTVNPEVAVSFKIPETGGEGIVFLHKLDKIERIRLELQPDSESGLQMDRRDEEDISLPGRDKMRDQEELPKLPDMLI